ncbi:N-acetylmuramoyl-L-alanine amidase [Streptomyces longwoodensis]|uniref:peptidoglycan recognition protein family protein n=1 Tax=Streptomyces longwoodensis TaxID=68231 RepID=UPI0036E52761
MAWYPGASKMELQPESDDQPAIRPTQLIVHSIAAPWTPKRTYEYWRDSTNLESHFGLGYDGSLAQFIGTETRADANASANRRADGTGAISVESASNLNATDPWTDEQVETLIKLGVWAHEHPRHAIPLRLCRSADDPGFGWHAQYAAWNPNGHACPGATRIRQFKEVVFPGIVARATGKTNPPPPVKETTMALTEQDIRLIGRQVVTGPTGMKNPDDPNVDWALSSFIGLTFRTVRQTAADVAEVKAKLDALTVGGVDLDALADKVADKLASRLAE